jgi:hypothetical protein
VDSLQRLVPTLRSGDDGLGIGLPDERLGVLIVLFDEVFDGCLKRDDKVEDAALEFSAAQLGEEAVDRVEPRGGGRCEMEGPARVAGEPRSNIEMLVRGIVVEDHLDRLALGHLAFDGVEKADELLVAMPLHVAADDRAIEDIERCKERRGAVALVVMCHRAEPALLHRQAGLGAIEHLTLQLLVDGKHHRMLWRIDVEPDHVLDLLGEGAIVGELELPPAMRHQARLAPDHVHLRPRYAVTGR